MYSTSTHAHILHSACSCFIFILLNRKCASMKTQNIEGKKEQHSTFLVIPSWGLATSALIDALNSAQTMRLYILFRRCYFSQQVLSWRLFEGVGIGQNGWAHNSVRLGIFTTFAIPFCSNGNIYFPVRFHLTVLFSLHFIKKTIISYIRGFLLCWTTATCNTQRQLQMISGYRLSGLKWNYCWC